MLKSFKHRYIFFLFFFAVLFLDELRAQQLAYNIVADDDITIFALGNTALDFGTHVKYAGRVEIDKNSAEAIKLRVTANRQQTIKISILNPILHGPGGNVIIFRSDSQIKSTKTNNVLPFNGNVFQTTLTTQEYTGMGRLVLFELHVGGWLDIGNVGPGDYTGSNGTITIEYI